MKKLFLIFWTAITLLILSGCSYNQLQQQDEGVKAAWAEVLNQYQRRSDLIPNLVQTVKGFAKHEEKVFIEVTNARSKVGSIQMTGNIEQDEGKLKQYAAAQQDMSGALSRLLAVAENYPNLKSDANFRELQAQLEGTENRVTLARNRFIQSVQAYNLTVRSFPSNITAMIFKMPLRPTFVADEEKIKEPPKVEF